MLTVSRSNAPYHHGDLAATLVQAAVDLLTEQGTPGVSLRAVARRAGVSHNAPYHHFGDRQGLLKAVAARGLGDMLAAMVAARDRADSSRQRLVDVGVSYVDFAIEHPAVFEIIFDPAVCDPRDPSPVTRPLIEANDEFLNTTVREAFPAETPDDLIGATAAAVWGMVHGLAVLVSAGHLDPAVARPGLESLLSLRLDGDVPSTDAQAG